MSSLAISLSSIDEERFGIRTARTDRLEPHSYSEALEYCRSKDVRLLIARCPTTDMPLVHRMEQDGFELMDTLVYYRRKLATIPEIGDLDGIVIRPVRLGEEHLVEEIAAESFRGYSSHYHADPRLDVTLCDAAYRSWAVRSCVSREVADQVLVAGCEGRLIGFATLRLRPDGDGEGVLFGVAPAAQGRGLYSQLMLHGMKWCRSQDRRWMIVSTQVSNLAVQKVWVRLGFEAASSCYTFHKWFKDD